ncbi:MAG: ankyrin repeat domain-containing protein [Candidatus Babeliales bacterium]|jgi:hypothetical protein|nr:MAG: WD40 repeat-containing protein [candidate division TM6 bacterium GW2011_GWF2_36_6]
MKNIKKLVLTGFITGFILANISAAIPKISYLQDEEALAIQQPSSSRTQSPYQISVTPSLVCDETVFEEIFDPNSLLGLPDELILNILVKYIEDNLKSEDQGKILNEIEITIKELKHLRLISKTFANLLTYDEIIKILRSIGIVELASQINPETGETLLHRAIRTGYIALARILIKAGVNVNAKLVVPQNPKFSRKFSVGSTPLHIASENGYYRIVDLLIQHGADITATVIDTRATTLNNVTSLDLARNSRHTTVIEIIENAYIQKGLASPVRAEDGIDDFTL